MKHQYRLKNFGTTMHMSLGRGGYVYVRSGTIECPTLPELHGKTITSNSGRETRKHEPYEVWKIEGFNSEFDSGAQIVEIFNLEYAKPVEAAQNNNQPSPNAE